MLVPPPHHGIEILIPEESEFAEPLQASANQCADELEVAPRVGIPHLAVLVEVEDADVGELRRIQPFVEIGRDPFQIRSLTPKAFDPRRIEIHADEAPWCERAFAFEQFQGPQSRRAHQLAPIAAQPSSLRVLPK